MRSHYLAAYGALTITAGALTAWVYRRPDANYAVLWTVWGLHLAWAGATLGGIGYAARRFAR